MLQRSTVITDASVTTVFQPQSGETRAGVISLLLPSLLRHNDYNH